MLSAPRHALCGSWTEQVAWETITYPMDTCPHPLEIKSTSITMCVVRAQMATHWVTKTVPQNWSQRVQLQLNEGESGLGTVAIAADQWGRV